MNAMDEARLEIAETRAHLHETAEELSAALSHKVDTAKQRVSPAHYAREYPWAALGLAVGVGLAIGLAGADKKAAAGIAAGASSVKDKVVERFQADGAADVEPVVAEPEAPHEPSVRERIAGEIDTMLADGLQDFMKSVGVSASLTP
jgi:hypothetical protein